MAFQRVPWTVQLEFRYSSGTVPFVNTLYAQKPLGYDANDLDTLLDTVELAAEADLIASLASSVTYTGVTGTGLDTQFDISGSRTPAAPVAGGVAGFAAPINVAFAVKMDAGLTGRSTRGRNYVGGIPESVVSDRLVSSTWANAVVSSYENMKAEIFAAGWTLSIVSRYSNGVKRPEAQVFAVVNISYSDLQVDTRRSRLNNA